MGMSTYVEGFAPPDEEFKKMKRVWDTCKEAGIDPPKEVWEYFEDREPDEDGVKVELPINCYSDYNDSYRDGIEIDLTKLPKKVKIIRFVNSY